MTVWVPRALLGIGAAALIAAIVAIAVGEGGPQPREIGGVNETQRLIGGIEQDGAYIGPAEAEVTITVFNDLQCTDCAGYQLETIDPLIEAYARTGEARLEFRHFPLTERQLTVAALAAEAAGEQDRQWQFIDLFFRNQDAAGGVIDDEFLREVAVAVTDLDLDRWEEDRESEAVAEAVRADGLLAAELELPAEPAVVVSGPAGQRELLEYPPRNGIDAAVATVSS
jgi:protein-disulfide isomerase